jgi:hypothetical protein
MLRFMRFIVFCLLVFGVSGKRPDAGTNDWLDIVMNGTSGTTYYEGVLAEHKRVCDGISGRKNKRGFLTEKDKTESCRLACYGIVIKDDCDMREEKSVTKNVGDRLMIWAGQGDEFTLDNDTLDTWFAILMRLWPLLLSVLPVLLQQWGYYRWPQATACIIVCLGFFMFINITYAQKLYLIVTCFACLISSGSYGVVPEVVGGLLTLGFFICVSFMSGIIFQLGTAIAIVLAYLSWLAHAFINKRHGALPGVLVMITILMVMAEQITLLRSSYQLFSFNMDILEMLLRSIVPSGESWFFSRNSMRLAAITVQHLTKLTTWAADFQVQLFFVFTIVQFVCVFAFRALFGMFVILAMRYRFTAENVYKGWVVYMGDVFGGIITLVKMLFFVERFESRRFSYAIINVLLLYFEAMYACDILMLRIIVCGIDNVAGTKYSCIPKYLQVNMNYADFPQKGAHPWIGLKKISALADYVVKVKCKDDNAKLTCGLGFLRKAGNSVHLMSVGHVIENLRSLSFLDTTLNNPQPTSLSESIDPVVSIQVSTRTPGADVALLDRGEIQSINNLFFVKLDSNDEAMITFVSKFSFDDKMEIRASVDLDYGNSGGPVFAVMDNDSIRYAGAVSAGDYDTLNGNFISSVIACAGPKYPIFESDNESYGSNCGKKVMFDRGLESSDSSALVHVLNKRSQGFHDKCMGFYYIDPSVDGKEVRHFDKYGDVMEFIDEMFKDEGIKHDSANPKRTPGRKRGKITTKKALVDEIGKTLRGMHTNAAKVLGRKGAYDYMRDVRCGERPLLTFSDGYVIHTPAISSSIVLKDFDYDD